MHTAGLLLHFLTRLARHKCVFVKGSERLQAVISALTSSKFYRLPSDKENPECLRLMSPKQHFFQYQEVTLSLLHTLKAFRVL